MNDELMTRCPMMNLGLNGTINEQLRSEIINDPLVNKVIKNIKKIKTYLI